MPVLKAISGHANCASPMRYLTKNDRALAVDFINLDASVGERERAAFDWASVMDTTRSAYGNDTPWGNLPCRTYKHYILSPDPKDGIGLNDLRAWPPNGRRPPSVTSRWPSSTTTTTRAAFRMLTSS